jgi:hypothetical protein
MLTRRGNRLRGTRKRSIAGTGLLERLRSTTFALLGVTTALGLALVAVIAQQGFSPLPGLPLPGISSQEGRVGEAQVVARPASRPAAGDRGGGTAAAGSTGAGDGSRPSAPSRLADSRQAGPAAPPAPAPSGGGAPGQDAPPIPVPPAPPASESPPAVAAAPGPATSPAVAPSSGKSTAAVTPESEERDQQAAAVPTAPPGTGIDLPDEDADTGVAPSRDQVSEAGGRRNGRGNGYGRSGR